MEIDTDYDAWQILRAKDHSIRTVSGICLGFLKNGIFVGLYFPFDDEFRYQKEFISVLVSN